MGKTLLLRCSWDTDTEEGSVQIITDCNIIEVPFQMDNIFVEEIFSTLDKRESILLEIELQFIDSFQENSIIHHESHCIIFEVLKFTKQNNNFIFTGEGTNIILN